MYVFYFLYAYVFISAVEYETNSSELMYHYFLLYSKNTSRSSYDKMKNDRKEKCDDMGNKHILKANLSLFYDIYLSSYTQEHQA